jgi:hypothetical protein
MLKAHNVVIASVSEAIQAASKELDCFVASAPRNDVDGSEHGLAFSRHHGWTLQKRFDTCKMKVSNLLSRNAAAENASLGMPHRPDAGVRR